MRVGLFMIQREKDKIAHQQYKLNLMQKIKKSDKSELFFIKMIKILSSIYLKIFLKTYLLFVAIFLIISILNICWRKIECKKVKRIEMRTY